MVSMKYVTELSVIDLIANVIAYTSVIPIVLFIYFYGTRPRKGAKHWWQRKFSRLWLSTEVGVTLMLQMILWFLFLLFVTASLVFHDWYGKDILRVLIYGGLVFMFWQFFIALRRLQTQPTHKENELGVTLDSDIENTRPRKRKPRPTK